MTALDVLRGEIRPIVADALRLTPRAAWCSVRIGVVPLEVMVVVRDPSNLEVAHFEASGTPAIGAAVAELVSDCLAHHTPARATAVRNFAARNPRALTLLADAALSSAHLVLDPGGSGDVFEVGSLMPSGVVH